MSAKIKTKYGTAKIDDKGYYRITSGKEGNNGKYLHRLVFADFYGLDDIDEFFGEKMEIHHNDGDKLNNKIYNLIPLTPSEHRALHKKGENHPFYGKHHSAETKQKMSENHVDFRGKNHPFYGKKHTQETRKKISENHADFSGKNHPSAKYDKLWDIESVYYNKRMMFRYGREPNPCKCFKYKYRGKHISMGHFHDFTSVEIINDLVTSILEEEKED